VSNTPWIEQHPYILHESIQGVDVVRKTVSGKLEFEATWLKEFHVSPFMEMDYKYKFNFSDPNDELWVRSQMNKLSTGEVWFSASFKMKSMDISPLNLLYVLVWYPFHTRYDNLLIYCKNFIFDNLIFIIYLNRIIQVWIHWEAVKLWFKGVPVFGHPNDADVDFGLGITAKGLLSLIAPITTAFWPATNKID
jgi:DUF1365 family protein